MRSNLPRENPRTHTGDCFASLAMTLGRRARSVRVARLRSLWRGHQRVIDLFGAHRGRPRIDTGPVAFERGTLLDRPERQSEADLRPDINVGRREATARQ